MAFNIMKRENRTISRGQLRNGLVEGDAVNHRHSVRVLRAFYDLHRSFAGLCCLLHAHPAFAEVHQHLINGQTVKPGGKSRFASKTSNFSKELYEDLLCEVFGL